jgi:3-oxoadipate enol-lactonase
MRAGSRERPGVGHTFHCSENPASTVWHRNARPHSIDRLVPTSGIATYAAPPSHPAALPSTTQHKPQQAGRALSYHTVTSADGTRLRSWSNEGAGVPVLICNGLGTPPDAWPAITGRTDTYRVFTWDQRGLGGSERPADESRITIADHTDDCLAVMDFYGVERAVVIGWSVGVNIAFEAAVREPKRVAGILAVAGVPGGTFEALLHPLPRRLRPRAGKVGAHLMRYLGPVLNRLGDGLPGSADKKFDPRGLSTLGLDLVHADTLVRVLKSFADHDWPWYSRLARAVGDHPTMDLGEVDMPVTYLAGTWDAITSAERMRAASAQTARSQYVELPATHFVPLQFPDRVLAELNSLVARCEL